MWLLQASAAQRALTGLEDGSAAGAFYRGKLAAAQYWLLNELPRVPVLATLIASGEDSYGRARPEWF
jgi:hypothetical protein